MATDPIAGYCPACGNRTLYRGFQGRVWCGNSEFPSTADDCPDPGAADALLNEPYTTDHIVEWSDDGDWAVVRHPLIERIAETLLNCTANQLIGSINLRYAMQPGRYRFRSVNRAWTPLEKIEPTEGSTDA